MKNKFFLFSPIFLFVLLIFLIYPQTSFAWGQNSNASTGDSVILGLSIEETTANASGTLTSTGADAAAGGVGFVVGTATGVYTATSSRYDNGYATGTDFSWSITAAGTGAASSTNVIFSPGTLYYYRAYASNTVSVGYGSLALNEKTLLTKPNDPAGLARTGVVQNSIDLSWTKGTGAGKTYLRYKTDSYPTSITDGTQGCISSGTSCSVSGLGCGTKYYLRAWSSTTAAAAELTKTSDSYTELTEMTVGCLTTGGTGGRTLRPPTTYPDSLVINKGAESAKTREVELSLKADETQYMVVSNDTLFLSPLEGYSTTKKWTLTEGDGLKTVYIKFVSLDGMNSDIISDTITLKTPEVVIEVPKVVEEVLKVIEEVPVVEKVPDKVVEKLIAEMTKEELTAKIAEILAQVEVLKIQLAELKEVVIFEVSLKYGDRGDKIVKLQEVLIQEGLLGQGLATGWFGPLTKTAVIKFQEKYASEILTPLGLISGTGFVGSSTRAKLSELSGK